MNIWGPVQKSTVIASGICKVSTASHGGVVLSDSRNQQVPEYMRIPNGHYEEDLDYAIPLVVFEQEFRALLGDDVYMDQLRVAKRTLADERPDLYEKFYGLTLQPGESRRRDRQGWEATNAGRLGVLRVEHSLDAPLGMIPLQTYRLGDPTFAPRGIYLVPKEEYEDRDALSQHAEFLIDEARHTFWNEPHDSACHAPR